MIRINNNQPIYQLNYTYLYLLIDWWVFNANFSINSVISLCIYNLWL